MAVTAPVVKAAIISELATLGALTDSDKQDKFAQAMANVIVNTVIPNLQIAGATGTGTPGGPLPIALPPGSVT